MNKDEMVKEAYTLMVKNNPDEAIKNLIRLDKELDKKNKIVFKAIEYIEKSMNNPQPFYKYIFGDENGKAQNLDKLLDILRGEDEN